MIKLLTGAVATAAAAAAGPVGWIVLGTIATAIAVVGGISLIKKAKEDKWNQLEDSPEKVAYEAYRKYMEDNEKNNPELYKWLTENQTFGQVAQSKVDEERTELERRAENAPEREVYPVIDRTIGQSGTVVPTNPTEDKTDEKEETTVTPTPTPGGENKDDEKDEASLPGIKDETDTNITQPITEQMDWLAWMEEQQKKRWEREDQIRAETQEREDSAYQRAVADMKKAGINVGLVAASLQPAQSGGGITQASGVDTSALTNQMQIDSEELQQLLDQYFEGNEADKDRVIKLIGSVIAIAGLILTKKKG